MPTRFTHLAVDVAEPAAIARFWAELLGWSVGYEDAEESFVNGSEPDLGLAFVPVPEPKTGKNRLHLDLASSSVRHQEELVARALDLGGRRIDIGQPAGTPWSVLADPAGNEFCVLEPRDWYAGGGPVAAMVLDCADPAALAPFLSAAVGWPVHTWTDRFVVLRPPAAGAPWLVLLRSAEPKRGKNRIHIDVAPFAGDDHAAEVARLRGLGARPADVGQGDVPWAVLVDPQGNEFCVLTPR
ncbi:MAG TPA: VOC family protein [Actinophytocola sp.]|uniref:VOC family protein n=1 Tax=Actinophytocola sp. TaxID=1872138 RepID=UPI002DB6B762|nr:VOC family protein [Actinophytocola sp.]HEU5474009.1 VOC family protein [Actinophytocola sp.]